MIKVRPEIKDLQESMWPWDSINFTEDYISDLKNNHKTKELELEKKVKDILYPEAHRRNREDFN